MATVRARYLASGLWSGLAALALVGLVLLTNPVPFHGSLTQTSQAGTWNGGDVSGRWVVVKLDFSSPSSIAATAFVITATAPAGASIVLPNGSTVGSARIVYQPGGYPPFLCEMSANNWWTGFTTVITNPDGSLVTNVQPMDQSGVASPYVESGALLNMSFPVGVDPTGYTISVQIPGAPGSTAVTLGSP